MKKTIALLIVSAFVFAGCGPQTRRIQTDTRLAQWFANDFKEFPAPAVSAMKGGESRVFENASYDEVWEAVTLVLIQDGVIAHSSKHTGVVVGLTRPPLGVYVERSQGKVPVYLYWMKELYTAVDEPAATLVYFPELNTKAADFLDRISTQLYAGKKWKYLYAGN